MAIKQKPKNRKKAYKPKKDQINKDQIKQIVRSKGIEGLRDHFANYEALEKHHLEMRWDIFDVNTTTDLYCLMHGISLEKDEPLPLSVLQAVYKGDLIIALRKNLIESVQGFKIKIKAKARRFDNPSIEFVVPPYEMDFSDRPICYNIFMRGKDAGRYTFSRDGAFKSVWKGITAEWKGSLDKNYSDDYEIFDAQAVLSCTTTFKSWAEEKQFKQLKLMGQVKRA